MKKLISIVAMCALLVAALAGCGQNGAGTEPVGGVNETAGTASAEVLEILGMSEEEFAALDPQQQQAILDELGAVMEQQQQQEQAKEEAKTYTPDDVMAGGSYKVVLGDYMNSITLYYENGRLVKLEEAFQKSSEEESELYTVEGDALAEYSFNFIDWDGAPLQDILDGMKDYGGFGHYEITAVK